MLYANKYTDRSFDFRSLRHVGGPCAGIEPSNLPLFDTEGRPYYYVGDTHENGTPAKLSTPEMMAAFERIAQMVKASPTGGRFPIVLDSLGTLDGGETAQDLRGASGV